MRAACEHALAYRDHVRPVKRVGEPVQLGRAAAKDDALAALAAYRHLQRAHRRLRLLRLPLVLLPLLLLLLLALLRSPSCSEVSASRGTRLCACLLSGDDAKVGATRAAASPRSSSLLGLLPRFSLGVELGLSVL